MALPLRKLQSIVVLASAAAAAARSACSAASASVPSAPPPPPPGRLAPEEAATSAAEGVPSAAPKACSLPPPRGVASSRTGWPEAAAAAAAAAACSAARLGDTGRCGAALPGDSRAPATAGLLPGEAGSCSGGGVAAARRWLAPERGAPGVSTGVPGACCCCCCCGCCCLLCNGPSACQLPSLLGWPGEVRVKASSSWVACSMAPCRASCGACSSHSTARDRVEMTASGQLRACSSRAAQVDEQFLSIPQKAYGQAKPAALDHAPLCLLSCKASAC
jgi:hypothetical protein